MKDNLKFAKDEVQQKLDDIMDKHIVAKDSLLNYVDEIKVLGA